MVTSPIPWIGGKHYSAQRIVEAFPNPALYDAYVEPFGGAASVLLARPRNSRHTEVFNDINGDLVNFWTQCRDNAAHLEARLASLPYSRAHYYQYHKSLSSETLDPLERAVRWFYVQRSSFTGWERGSSATGWKASTIPSSNDARAYHSAISLLTRLQERFKHVLIDARDFEKVIASYNRPRSLFYCDPPYIGAEQYYRHPFTMADHERLAQLLNASPAFIAISYYPHPALGDLYPEPEWRRITWRTVKHSQRTKETRDQAVEILLCNYAPGTWMLWDEQ